MANVEACRVVYNYLVEHPEEHNQEVFGERTSCGTTMCVAGTAIMLHRPDIVKWITDDERSEVLQMVVYGDCDVQEVARVILGLSDGEADDLFYCFSNEVALNKLGQFAQIDD